MLTWKSPNYSLQTVRIWGGDKFGYSPLHYAAHHGNKEIVTLLITNSADVNAKGKGGETPLSMAANKETADLLRKHGGKYGTFIGAVAGGDIDAVKMFLDAGSDLNEKVQHGWTPLHETAVFGHAEVAKLLIANGADVNALDGVVPKNGTRCYESMRRDALPYMR